MTCSRRGPLRYVCGQTINPTAMIIPREARGYSVELFGLSVLLSVRHSHPWKKGPLRHVCDQTDYRTTMIHTFLESPSNLDVHPGIHFWIFKKFRRNWRLKVHYMAMLCSRRGPLRHVCGQTIYPTAMNCTCLESPTDLDVHPGKGFALFARNRRIWQPKLAPKTTKFARCGPDRRGSSPADDNFLFFFF